MTETKKLVKRRRMEVEATSYRLMDDDVVDTRLTHLYEVVLVDGDGFVHWCHLYFRDGAMAGGGCPISVFDEGWINALHTIPPPDYDGSDPDPERVAAILAMPQISVAKVEKLLRERPRH